MPDSSGGEEGPKGGWTALPNITLEALARAQCSASELAAWLVVARLTLGWQRRAHTISAASVAGRTGMSLRQAWRALDGLVARGMLQRNKSLGQRTSELALVVDHGRWDWRGAQPEMANGQSLTPAPVQRWRGQRDPIYGRSSDGPRHASAAIGPELAAAATRAARRLHGAETETEAETEAETEIEIETETGTRTGTTALPRRQAGLVAPARKPAQEPALARGNGGEPAAPAGAESGQIRQRVEAYQAAGMSLRDAMLAVARERAEQLMVGDGTRPQVPEAGSGRG